MTLIKTTIPIAFLLQLLKKGKTKQKAILIEARALYQKKPKTIFKLFYTILLNHFYQIG